MNEENARKLWKVTQEAGDYLKGRNLLEALLFISIFGQFLNFSIKFDRNIVIQHIIYI